MSALNYFLMQQSLYFYSTPGSFTGHNNTDSLGSGNSSLGYVHRYSVFNKGIISFSGRGLACIHGRLIFNTASAAAKLHLYCDNFGLL